MRRGTSRNRQKIIEASSTVLSISEVLEAFYVSFSLDFTMNWEAKGDEETFYCISGVQAHPWSTTRIFVQSNSKSTLLVQIHPSTQIEGGVAMLGYMIKSEKKALEDHHLCISRI